MVKVEPHTDFIEARFDIGQKVFIGETEHTILDVMVHKTQLRLKLSGITKVEQAEALQWATLCASAETELELEDDDYLVSDLEGLDVFLENGTQVGTVEAVIAAPAQDLIQVQGRLIPLVKQFVVEVDLEEERLVLRPIPGLLDDASIEAGGPNG